MSRWPYRPHRSDACNEVDKAHVCAQSVHSRTLIIRSGARTEFPELLYAAKHFLATSQPVATRNPNASQRKINSEILQRFIHTLTVCTPCSPRTRHIKIPLNTEGTLQTCYADQRPQADCHKRYAVRQNPHNSKGQGTMIKRPPQQTKVHIVHKTIKKSQMTTDYVKRHGLKPTMRAFSVNDTMINGAPEHTPSSCCLRSLHQDGQLLSRTCDHSTRQAH